MPDGLQTATRETECTWQQTVPYLSRAQMSGLNVSTTPASRTIVKADAGECPKYETRISFHMELFCGVTLRTQACSSPLALRNDLAGADQKHAIGDSRLAAKADQITCQGLE